MTLNHIQWSGSSFRESWITNLIAITPRFTQTRSGSDFQGSI